LVVFANNENNWSPITQKTKDWATRSPQENIENTLQHTQSLRTSNVLQKNNVHAKRSWPDNTFYFQIRHHLSIILRIWHPYFTIEHQRNRHTQKLSLSTYW
jgi:hypothetical protein